MAHKYNVTFTGVILSGFDKVTVKPQVAQLLKLPPDKVDAFFSGKSITIKKNIDLESALKIQSALNSRGLTIQITEDRPPAPIITDEPDEKPMFELVRDEPEPVPEAKPNPRHEHGPALAAAATMGAASQVRRNPINNPRKMNEEMQSNAITNVWDEEDENDDDQPAEAVSPPFIGLSFDGRYGRLNFVNATTLFFVSFIVFTLVTSFMPFSFVLTAAFFLAPVYFFVRHLSLRLHDLNLPSIVSLLIWVPYVNTIFLIALLVIPGKKGSNDYGPPSARGPIWGLLGLGVVSLLLMYASMSFVATMSSYYKEFEDYEKNKIPPEEVALVAKPFVENLLSGQYDAAIALTSAKYQHLNLSSTLSANFDGFKFSNKISKLKLNDAETEYEYYYSFDNTDKVRFGGAWIVLDGETDDRYPTQAVISLLVIYENGSLKIHDVNFNEESYYGDYDDYDE